MRRTVTGILYILMGVQIAFGCVWFVCNFGVEQQFRENIASFLPMGGVSLIQLVLAAVSTWYVLGKLGFRKNKYLRGFVCAFLLTVPYLLQMHMARLVWSAALSCFLWLLGLLLETVQGGLSGKREVGLFTAYVLYGVICPDGIWVGGVMLSAVFLLRGKHISGAESEKQRNRGSSGARLALVVILAAGVIFMTNMGLNKVFPQARGIYRENTLGMTAISRFVWPNFGKNYYFWTGEVKEVLSEDEAVEISMWADLVAEDFYFQLEEMYGKRHATKLCIEMGQNCLKYRTRETVLEIGRDFRDYLLLPFTIENNLKGEGVSLTAWNYERMRGHTPILVKYYYRYGMFELPILLLGSILLWCFQSGGRITLLPARWKYMLFVLMLYTVWYTMRSNYPIDYKMTLPILFIWYLAAACGLLEEERI